jgi:hypothetical protein
MGLIAGVRCKLRIWSEEEVRESTLWPVSTAAHDDRLLEGKRHSDERAERQQGQQGISILDREEEKRIRGRQRALERDNLALPTIELADLWHKATPRNAWDAIENAYDVPCAPRTRLSNLFPFGGSSKSGRRERPTKRLLLSFSRCFQLAQVLLVYHCIQDAPSHDIP